VQLWDIREILVVTEAEESQFLISVTRKRLVNTDLEGLACAVVICKGWRLAIVLRLLVVTLCKWSIDPISNQNPVYSHAYT
jgi:hypothetical protein